MDINEKFDHANLYYKCKDYTKALELYQECIDSSSNKGIMVTSLYNMGTTYLKLGKYNDAINCFKKVTKFKGYRKLSFAFFNMGCCYIFNQNYYLAYKALKKSHSIDPYDIDCINAINNITKKLLIKKEN